VHSLIDLHAADAWGKRTASSKVVFIGRGLDADTLRSGLTDCLVD